MRSDEEYVLSPGLSHWLTDPMSQTGRDVRTEGIEFAAGIFAFALPAGLIFVSILKTTMRSELSCRSSDL